MYIVKTSVQPSKIHGKGYFAEEDIPVGTIVYFYSAGDIHYSKEQFQLLNATKKQELSEFAVEDEFGNWVLTKTGPYTNHSCDANILGMFVNGNYCDIAVKNISKSSEITVDYGMFFSSVVWKMECKCGSDVCRKEIGFGFSAESEAEQIWEKEIRNAVGKIREVKQPILTISDPKAVEISKVIKAHNGHGVGKFIKYCLISSQK